MGAVVSMRKIVYLFFAAVSLFFGYFTFHGLPGRDSGVKPGAAGPIVCFGDSLTFGTGAAEGMDYPSQLSALLGKKVINAGVPGDTTASALARLRRDVLVHAPATVVITLGGNDLKNGVPADEALANLIRIVETLQQAGCRVIVGGLKFPLHDRGYGRAYEELARRTGAVLIPHILEGIIGRPALMADPIHPNGNGYATMARRFYDTLQ